MNRPVLWNWDKPHRCPNCHVTTDPRRRARWQVVDCHRCGCAFARWPRIARRLPRAGVVFNPAHLGGR